MLTVYVDDLVLGGPVKLDDQEPLNCFLGSYHVFEDIEAPEVDVMAYCQPQQK